MMKWNTSCTNSWASTLPNGIWIWSARTRSTDIIISSLTTRPRERVESWRLDQHQNLGYMQIVSMSHVHSIVVTSYCNSRYCFLNARGRRRLLLHMSMSLLFVMGLFRVPEVGRSKSVATLVYFAWDKQLTRALEFELRDALHFPSTKLVHELAQLLKWY